MTDIMNNLTAGVNLDDAGREGVEVSGGGSKFATAVPSGYYLACLNRVGALGPITAMQSGGKGKKPESRTTETIKIGFELLELVVPNNPADADFELIKEYKKDDGTVDKVPYFLDMNGMFNITRSSSDRAKFPKILTRMRDALPYDVQDAAKASHGTVAKRYPTVKSMFGQQFVVYVQQFEDTKGTARNEILFSATNATKFTTLNETLGFPKEVGEFIEMHPHDEANRKVGFSQPLEKGTPLHANALLFDIGADDMTQANLDSVAQETIYIGANAIAGKDKMVRFCDLLQLNLRLGKYSDVAFGQLVSKGTLVIPEPQPYRGADTTTTKQDDSYDESAIADVKNTAPAVVKETTATTATATAEEEFGV